MIVSDLIKAAQEAKKNLNEGFDGEVYICTDERTYQVEHAEFTGEEFHIHAVPLPEDVKDKAESALEEALENAREAGLEFHEVEDMVHRMMEDD
jgi:MoxR-like ATPase